MILAHMQRSLKGSKFTLVRINQEGVSHYLSACATYCTLPYHLPPGSLDSTNKSLTFGRFLTEVSSHINMHAGQFEFIRHCSIAYIRLLTGDLNQKCDHLLHQAVALVH